MAPLLCLGPALLDQSFPRDDDELSLVVDALGELQEHLDKRIIGLVMTGYLWEIADPENFDYSRIDECWQLRDILRLVQQWALQPHEGIEAIDVSGVQQNEYKAHPVPKGCEGKGLAEFWQDEVGRILFVHDTVCRGSEYFIGVACESAFAGGEGGKYDDPGRCRCFPLIGPDDIGNLSSAYEWEVPHDVVRKKVTVADFQRNCGHIGAIRISPPSRGSHFTVEFRGGRSWPLDSNCNPIPQNHLSTLSQTTGYPVGVLKDCLINGRDPRKVCRLRNYQG